MSDVILANGRIIDPSRGIDEIGSVVIQSGAIVSAGARDHNQGAGPGFEVIDCSGKWIVPGLIDTRVFIGEPGGEHLETIASASAAAASGGVTTLVMMPDTNPVLDDIALVDFVTRTASATAKVRIVPSAAITRGLQGREMTEFGLLKQAGAVCFTEGRKTLSDPLVMRRAMTYARDFAAVIAHETHDRELAASGVMNEGLLASWLGLPGIPREAEVIPLDRDLRLAALTGAAYHAAKLSTAMSANAVRRAKSDGVDVTAAISVNHATLNENDVGEYRTYYRLTPPLRHEDDRLAIVEALRDGTIDMICSSHDPQDVDGKRVPFADATPGAIGLETLLGATMRLFHDGNLSATRIMELLSTAPARRFGLAGGTLAPGSAADIAIIDPDEPWVVREADIVSRSKNTCFEGAVLTGRVLRTLVAGRTIHTV